jgi:hypothetical protein
MVILRTTVAFWLQKRGLIYVRKFDIFQKIIGKSERTSTSLLNSAQNLAIQKLKKNSTVALLGCGDEYLCDKIFEIGCTPTLLDFDSLEDQRVYKKPAKNSDSTSIRKNVDKFDYTLLFDTLCKTPDPENLVSSIHAAKIAETALIATVPNVGFILTRMSFLFGNLNYASRGVLRHEHIKLYTRASIIALFEYNNFKIESVEMTEAPFGNVFKQGLFTKTFRFLNLALIKLAPSLFGYSIVIKATPRSDLKTLLSHAALTWPRSRQGTK